MTRILLSEAAYRRLRPHLDALPMRPKCVVMDGQGVPRLDGRPVSTDDAAPQCAYLSGDVFMNSLTGIWLDTLLAAPALEWVQSAGAGLEHPMFARLAEKGVRLTTNHAQATALCAVFGH